MTNPPCNSATHLQGSEHGGATRLAGRHLRVMGLAEDVESTSCAIRMNHPTRTLKTEDATEAEVALFTIAHS